MTKSRTMANLLATLKAPRDRLNFDAAIAERASRITNRVMPPHPPVHGAYDPQGFVLSSRYMAARDQLYRDLCARIAQKELLRGRVAPERRVA